MPHIEVSNVSLVYDTPSGQVPGVADVSFDIEQSEFLCIVGPSGCGKSTLLNIIAGFLMPTAGEIRIAGKAVTGYGMDRREATARKQLQLVKLEKFENSYPHHLSGGMQQRVAIARALAYNPAV